jgi:hypothetical protein
VVTGAISSYGEEVRNGSFPAEEHCYRMIEGEYPKFQKMVKQFKVTE